MIKDFFTIIGCILGSIVLLLWVAFYFMCLATVGYIAYEILFTDALSRWFA